MNEETVCDAQNPLTLYSADNETSRKESLSTHRQYAILGNSRGGISGGKCGSQDKGKEKEGVFHHFVYLENLVWLLLERKVQSASAVD